MKVVIRFLQRCYVQRNQRARNMDESSDVVELIKNDDVLKIVIAVVVD